MHPPRATTYVSPGRHSCDDEDRTVRQAQSSARGRRCWRSAPPKSRVRRRRPKAASSLRRRGGIRIFLRAFFLRCLPFDFDDDADSSSNANSSSSVSSSSTFGGLGVVVERTRRTAARSAPRRSPAVCSSQRRASSPAARIAERLAAVGPKKPRSSPAGSRTGRTATLRWLGRTASTNSRTADASRLSRLLSVFQASRARSFCLGFQPPPTPAPAPLENPASSSRPKRTHRASSICRAPYSFSAT
mmetsp:Transcript_1325/g.4516  ORF Transcript_1325/g.4516 Transcript_1325/m.4516 type:complete len:245 (+) Transcript_1325:341-1075(+)